MSRLNKSTVDVSAIFCTYIMFVGDAEKTAIARNLDVEFVKKLAASEDWNSKIKVISRMTGEGRPGDFERAQNRAMNFVQAHLTSQLIDRLISHLSEKTDADLADALTPRNRDGSPGPISARVFADLTAAMEKCHALKYNSLADSVREREERAIEDGNQLGATALHSAVISALNATNLKPVKVEALVQEAVDSTVKQLTVGTTTPPV